MSQDYNQMTSIAYFLIFDKIDSLNSEAPDIPDFQDDEMGQIWGQLNSKQLSSIGNRITSIDKILKHGIEAYDMINETELPPDDYNTYVTDRIHAFASDWLTEESKYDDKYLKRMSPEWEYGFYGQREDTLNKLSLETWEELTELVSQIEKYKFRSKGNRV